jgi:hypothetical protein
MEIDWSTAGPIWVVGPYILVCIGLAIYDWRRQCGN